MRPAPSNCVFVLAGPLGRRDVGDVCARFGALLDASDATVAWCDVAGLSADAAAVDALARITLAACRRGRRVRIRHASTELRELAALMGLGPVLGLDG